MARKFNDHKSGDNWSFIVVNLNHSYVTLLNTLLRNYVRIVSSRLAKIIANRVHGFIDSGRAVVTQETTICGNANKRYLTPVKPFATFILRRAIVLFVAYQLCTSVWSCNSLRVNESPATVVYLRDVEESGFEIIVRGIVAKRKRSWTSS